MILAVTLSALTAVALGAPSAEPGPGPGPRPHGYLHHGHGYIHHGPICTHELEEVEKEFCYYDHPEKVCETKTQTYKIVTGYEKGECEEVEVCKYPHWRKRRAAGAEPGPHYGYNIECEKDTKEVCKQEPVIEEKSQDLELCRYEPKRVCEDKVVKVPKLVCPTGEDSEDK